MTSARRAIDELVEAGGDIPRIPPKKASTDKLVLPVTQQNYERIAEIMEVPESRNGSAIQVLIYLRDEYGASVDERHSTATFVLNQFTACYLRHHPE